MTLTHLLCLPPVFMVADRFAGGDWCRRWGIKVRPVAVSTMFLLIVMPQLVGVHPGLVVALGWALWRWDGWGTFGGKIDPRTWPEVRGYMLRHCFALPVAIPLGLVGVPAMLAYVVVATALGMILARWADIGVDVNGPIEMARGACFGICVAIALAAST